MDLYQEFHLPRPGVTNLSLRRNVTSRHSKTREAECDMSFVEETPRGKVGKGQGGVRGPLVRFNKIHFGSSCSIVYSVHLALVPYVIRTGCLHRAVSSEVVILIQGGQNGVMGWGVPYLSCGWRIATQV